MYEVVPLTIRLQDVFEYGAAPPLTLSLPIGWELKNFFFPP